MCFCDFGWFVGVSANGCALMLGYGGGLGPWCFVSIRCCQVPTDVLALLGLLIGFDSSEV